MGRLTKITISGYRSIKDEIEIDLPAKMPLVLVGENNAGKSNIIKALDLILGEWWPGNKEPDDHEFWNRDRVNAIAIEVALESLNDTDKYGNTYSVDSLRWKYDGASGEPVFFKAYSGASEKWVTKPLREQCMCFTMGSDRKLSYQLGYSSKYTLLSKLMHKFHSCLIKDAARVEQLKGSFDAIKAIFQEVTEFGEFQKALVDKFGEMFGGMTYGLQVDFSAYDPSNFFHSLRMQATENNDIRTFEELGTGQEQLLALAFAHAYAKAFYGGIILAFEEPEAHLHPLAQEWLARKIHEMAADGLQIIITTHSPAFVNLLNLEGLVLVRKEDGATKIVQNTTTSLCKHCKDNSAHPTKTKVESILPFYSAAATPEITAGLFAKKIILVEGPTEALAVPELLKKAGFDTTKEGVAVIPVGGKGNLAKWWRFFTAYGIPIYVTFDNDLNNKDSNGSKRKDALKTIGITSDLDSILTSDEWVVANSYCVFAKDFEASMRKSFTDYEKFEREAKDRLATDSKPILARYAVTKLSRNADDGWKKLDLIVAALNKLTGFITMPIQTVVPSEKNESHDDDLPF